MPPERRYHSQSINSLSFQETVTGGEISSRYITCVEFVASQSLKGHHFEHLSLLQNDTLPFPHRPFVAAGVAGEADESPGAGNSSAVTTDLTRLTNSPNGLLLHQVGATGFELCRDGPHNHFIRQIPYNRRTWVSCITPFQSSNGSHCWIWSMIRNDGVFSHISPFLRVIQRKEHGMKLSVRWTTFLTILATLTGSVYSDDAPAFDGPGIANTDYPEMLMADPPLGCDCCLSGSLFQQDPHAAKLTGDWGGRRSHLAENGITFDASLTQFYQGVTSGGSEQLFHYTGHGEYLLNFDFGKLRMQEGFSLRMRAEHRFGETVNAASGALLPPSILSDLPTTATEDLVLTEVLFTQFLSENIAVSFGKMNTFPQGLTPFTGGRGDDTFMNMSAMFPTVAITSVPYSTLGAGITIFKDKLPFLTFNVLNSNDTITQSGFDQLFEDGVSLLGTIRLPTPLGEKPGVQTFGFSWNNREQIRIGQDPRVILPQFMVQTTNEAWSLFWQGFQYLQTYDNPQKGWGVFGAAGISENNPTFISYSLGFGIGGYVPLACRPNDRFGIAWFYNELSDELGPIVSVLVNPQNESGVEIFYNIEVTPSFHLTPDLQILNPALARGDAAILFALRAKIDF